MRPHPRRGFLKSQLSLGHSGRKGQVWGNKMNWIWLEGSLSTFSTRDGHRLQTSAALGRQEQGFGSLVALAGTMVPLPMIPREDRTQDFSVERISCKVHHTPGRVTGSLPMFLLLKLRDKPLALPAPSWAGQGKPQIGKKGICPSTSRRQCSLT